MEVGLSLWAKRSFQFANGVVDDFIARTRPWSKFNSSIARTAQAILHCQVEEHERVMDLVIAGVAGISLRGSSKAGSYQHPSNVV